MNAPECPPLPRVVIESPLAGRVPGWVPLWLAPLVERVGRYRNQRYAARCVRDSLARAEAPYASHVFFDRRGLLDDAKPAERWRGMHAGFAWGWVAERRAVYCDRGISGGMRLGISQRPPGQPVEYRYLDTPIAERVRVHCASCGNPIPTPITAPCTCGIEQPPLYQIDRVEP